MPRKKWSLGKMLIGGFHWWKVGLTKPQSMLAAKIDVAVWGAILVSTAVAVMTGVVNENWAGVWVNAAFGILQGTALRWSLHGLMYRREIRAKDREMRAFIEIVRNGYAVQKPPTKKRRT